MLRVGADLDQVALMKLETRHALSSRQGPDPAGRPLLPLLALFGLFALFMAAVVAASGCGKVAGTDDGAEDGDDPGGAEFVAGEEVVE